MSIRERSELWVLSLLQRGRRGQRIGLNNAISSVAEHDTRYVKALPADGIPAFGA